MYVVKIIRYSDGETEETIECRDKTEKQAEQVQRGIDINLNHEDYCTQIVWVDDKQNKENSS